MRCQFSLRGMAVLVAGFALVTVACGGTTSSSQGSATTAASPSPAAVVKTATKKVADKSQSILVDSKGLTLYYFTTDKAGTVTCTGACLQNWPPLQLPAGVTKPTGDKSVNGRLDTVANPERGTQVSYNGWPLYYYVKDKDPEDVYGQGVGGKWFVATPDLAPPS